jgi:lipase
MPLHVHRFGPAGGRPLVALHGLTGYGGRWRRFAEEQLPGFLVLAPDLRGHGLSPTAPPWTLERHAEDVLAVLDRSGLDKAPVVGHSFGATVSVYLARLAPERVERLILLDPGMGLPAHVAEKQAHAELNAASFAHPDEAAAERTRLWPPEAHHLVGEEVAGHLAQGPDGRWRWRYSVPAAVTAFSELARPAPVPPDHMATLLAVARRSPAVEPAYLEACRQALADRLTVAEFDSGHQIHLERAGETGALIRDFLS